MCLDGLNGAFNGRYGHTLIQNKNNSTTNWWGFHRDGGRMDISYGTTNAYGSLTPGQVMTFATDGNVGIGTSSPS